MAINYIVDCISAVFLIWDMTLLGSKMNGLMYIV